VECHYHVRSSLLNLASKHARFGGFKHVVCVWSQIFTHFGNRGNQRLLRVGLSGSEISCNFGQHKWKAQGKRRLDSTSLEIDFCQDASTWASTWQGVMLWEALDRYDLHQVIFWCQAPSKITLVPPFRSRRSAKEKAGYWWKIRKKDTIQRQLQISTNSRLLYLCLWMLVISLMFTFYIFLINPGPSFQVDDVLWLIQIPDLMMLHEFVQREGHLQRKRARGEWGRGLKPR